MSMFTAISDSRRWTLNIRITSLRVQPLRYIRTPMRTERLMMEMNLSEILKKLKPEFMRWKSCFTENILSVKQKHRRASCLIRENTLFSLRKTKQLIPLRIRMELDLSMKLCVEHWKSSRHLQTVRSKVLRSE